MPFKRILLTTILLIWVVGVFYLNRPVHWDGYCLSFLSGEEWHTFIYPPTGEMQSKWRYQPTIRPSSYWADGNYKWQQPFIQVNPFAEQYHLLVEEYLPHYSISLLNAEDQVITSTHGAEIRWFGEYLIVDNQFYHLATGQRFSWERYGYNYSFSISPDGHWLAYIPDDNTHLYLYEMENLLPDDPASITSYNLLDYSPTITFDLPRNQLQWLRWSPNSQSLAALFFQNSNITPTFYQIDGTIIEPKLSIPRIPYTEIFAMRWSADGEKFIHANETQLLAYDLATQEDQIWANDLADRIYFSFENQAFYPLDNPTQERIITVNAAFEVEVFNTDGQKVAQLATSEAQPIIQWLPNGLQAMVISTENQQTTLTHFDSQTEAIQHYPFSEWSDLQIIQALDVDHLIYRASQTDHFEIGILEFSTGKTTALLKAEGQIHAITPNKPMLVNWENHMAFIDLSARQSESFTLAAERTEILFFSPDQRLMLAESYIADNTYRMDLVNLETGNVTLLRENMKLVSRFREYGGNIALWSPDAQYMALMYAERDDAITIHLYLYDRQGQELAHFQNDRWYYTGLDWQPCPD